MPKKTLLRTRARQQGEAMYFEDFPCELGHIALRFTSTGTCSVCKFDNLIPERRKGDRPGDLSVKLRTPEQQQAFFDTFTIKVLVPRNDVYVLPDPRIRKIRPTDAERLAQIRRALSRFRLRKEDPMVSLKKRVRGMIANSLGKYGYSAGGLKEQIIGCSFAEFYAHIERQFLPGMTWAARRRWHLDHIVPLDTAENELDVIALNHFTNLRPLWSEDNLAKSNKRTHLI